MPVRPPALDDRSLPQIVQQLLGAADDAFGAAAAMRIPRWRLAQHLSEQQVRELLARPFDDPGLMLSLIFARLLELALQRLNRVPEKNRLAFLDAMGVSLLSPSPARVPLTFGLTGGTGPTFVPRGTQAATQSSGQQAAIVFETEDDLTVVPAQLTQAVTVDPTWDRYTDQTGRLDGANLVGFTPFVGTRRMPHVLYLGEEALLSFGPATAVGLGLEREGGGPPADVVRFFARLSYQYRTQGLLKTVTPAVEQGDGRLLVSLTMADPIDLETLQGVGLAQGMRSRWLRVVLTTPFPDDLVAQSLRIKGLRLRVSASGLRPDLAFSNTAPLGLTTEFLPFGETPKVGDAFYLGSGEAFAKRQVQVTLRFELPSPPPPTLVWEYFDSGFQQWRPLVVLPALDADDLAKKFTQAVQEIQTGKRQPYALLVDGTAGLTREGGMFGLIFHLGEADVNGIRARWIRVRLAAGGYRLPPNVAQFLIMAQANQLRPPEFGFTNESLIDFGGNFLPFGVTPSPADSFAFGEAGQGFPTVILADRTVSLLNFQIKLDPDPAHIPATADLRWEYLGPSGWTQLADVRSTTPDLRRDGTVTFTVPDAVRQQVNGQTSHWVRAWIVGGNYGEPAEFEAVDLDDPKRGFRLRRGTSNLRPPRIRSLTLDYVAERAPTVLTQNGFLYVDQTAANVESPNNQPAGFAPFVAVEDLAPAIYADPEPSFYLGFDRALPGQPVTLYVAGAPRAFAGSVVKDGQVAPASTSAPPPLGWEYFNGATWGDLSVFDRTRNLTKSGTVEFLTPSDIALLAKFDLTARYWVRARSARNDPLASQRVIGIFPNTVPAREGISIRDETVGSSNGQPGQALRLSRAPVLAGLQLHVREPEPPPEPERAAIEAEEGADAVQVRPNPTTGAPETWVRWHQVSTFLASDLRSRHYTLDHISGVVTFGDGQSGLVPPRGTNNIVAGYRSGGGPAGNVPATAVAKIQTALPGLATVINPAAADGGAAAETIPMVEERGPGTLRHRGRAVAAADFEWLACQAAGTRIARVRCLPNVNRELRFEPGWVTLLIVPRGTDAKLAPSSELIREVEDGLQARVFAGLGEGRPNRVNVIGPGYLQVTVVGQIVPQDVGDAEQVKQRALAALAAFFHPLTGGPNGAGWEFARDVYESEVSRVLERVPGVDHVKALDLVSNVAQHRLALASASTAVLDLPEGSAVLTPDRRKAALLAERVPLGARVTHLVIKGFKQGDRVTKVLDLTNPVGAGQTLVDGGPRPVVAVAPFSSDAVGFPRNSRVITFNGARQTRLARAIPRDTAGQTQIVVEDPDFLVGLAPSDVLTVAYPFPLTVTSVTLDSGAALQTLGVEPHDAEVAFPEGSLLATLDNRVRLPLAAAFPAQGAVTVVQARGFQKGEQLVAARRDGRPAALSLVIHDVEVVSDVVYLDDNFLVQSGPHSISMRAD